MLDVVGISVFFVRFLMSMKIMRISFAFIRDVSATFSISITRFWPTCECFGNIYLMISNKKPFVKEVE